MKSMTKYGKSLAKPRDFWNSLSWPFGGMLDVFDEFDRMLADRSMSDHMFSNHKFTVTQDDSAYYVRGELPGYKEEELSIEVSDVHKTICISGKSEKQDKSKEDLLSSSLSSFQRTYTLPDDVKITEGGDIEARYKDGILVVTLPREKVEEPGPDMYRKIEIKSE